MLKKTITYTDYNGETKTGDFYFNLNQAELMKMQMGTRGGLSEAITKAVADQDTPTIINIFDELILKAYGERRPDGRFEKNAEISARFMQTEAYSVLFMELATDADAAAAFINGIVPQDMAKKASLASVTD